MQARIADLCDVVIGRTPRRERLEYWGGTTPWVSIRDLNGGTINTTRECISDLAVREVMPRPVPAGTLLFSFKLTIGKTGLAARPLYTNEAIAALPIKRPDLITVSYLKYALEAVSAADDANHAVLGKVLNKEKVGDLRIKLPPLDEQQRIVDILDRAASIQRLRQAADEKLKQIIPALFVDMFGDPATNPKGWQKSALGGLINIRSSVRLPDLVSEADELCIGADAISSGDGKLLFQPTVGSVMPKSGKYFFHEGDVLYSKIRPYLCKAWLADCAGYCSADIYAIECKEQLTPHFLKYLLLSKDFTDYAVAQSSRASMPKVNREALSAYEFPLPPVELQREFSARAERVLSLAKLSSEASGSGDLSMASLSSQFFNAA